MGKHHLIQHGMRFRALIHRLAARRIAQPVPRWASDDTQPMTIATPVVRNGGLAFDAAPPEAELTWSEWLQQLPPVDGWTSISSWEAQHGNGAGAVAE